MLATDSDTENVDAALTARRLRPDVRLVVRVFDRRLADYLRGTLAQVEVLSMSLTSAPIFADLARRALAETAQAAAPPAAGRRRARRRLPIDRVLVTLEFLFPVRRDREVCGIQEPRTVTKLGTLDMAQLQKCVDCVEPCILGLLLKALYLRFK